MKFINIFIRLSIFILQSLLDKNYYTKKYYSGNPKIISYYLTEGIDEVIEHQYFGSGEKERGHLSIWEKARKLENILF